MRKRAPETFNSDIHLSKPRRLALWFLESGPGRSILGTTAASVLGIPLLLLGWWWAVVVCALLIGFVTGYWVARSYWLSGEDIPKL